MSRVLVRGAQCGVVLLAMTAAQHAFAAPAGSSTGETGTNAAGAKAKAMHAAVAKARVRHTAMQNGAGSSGAQIGSGTGTTGQNMGQKLQQFRRHRHHRHATTAQNGASQAGTGQGATGAAGTNLPPATGANPTKGLHKAAGKGHGSNQATHGTAGRS